MRVSLEQLAADAEATGFRADMLEKVAHLLGLLEAIQRHPFLKGITYGSAQRLRAHGQAVAHHSRASDNM